MADEAKESVYDSYSDYSKRLAVVNRGIAFTDIRGKAYAEVNQRILAFWALFPEGRIVTRKVGDSGQRCDFECDVYRHESDELPAVTGHAFEDRNTNINKTSYIENCETGAIGRALGMLGIGATTSIASADEVLTAIAQQEANAQPQPVPADNRRERLQLMRTLKQQAIANGVSEQGINEWYAANVGDVTPGHLTDAQLQTVLDYLSQIVSDTNDGHLKEGE